MEDPVADVPKVIDGLLHTRPSTQRATIEEYYTPTVAFHHPFCYVPSFSGGRWLVLKLYQWYKIMSPRVEHEIHSIAYDEAMPRLYVNMSQVFSIWLVPFHVTSVTLTVQLDLVKIFRDKYHHSSRSSNNDQNREQLYYVTKQEDLYQTSEFIKYVLAHGGHCFMIMLLCFGTFASVLGMFIFWPIVWAEEKGIIPGKYLRGGNIANDMGKKVPELKKRR